MAKKKNSKEKKKGAGGMKSTPLIIVALLLAFFIKGSFILLLVGVLPAFISFYADTSKRREVFRIVLTCNLVGVLPFLTELIMKNNSTSLLMEYLMNPRVWFMMYGSAGVGYMLVRGMPMLVEFFYEFSNAAKIARLQSMQNRLIEEWGPEIQRTK